MVISSGSLHESTRLLLLLLLEIRHYWDPPLLPTIQVLTNMKISMQLSMDRYVSFRLQQFKQQKSNKLTQNYIALAGPRASNRHQS